MAGQTKLTDEGLKKLEQELYNLKNISRKDVAEKIKQARAFGDLSENSEYDEAKNEQAKIEARIAELEGILANVVIIDESAVDANKIMLGSKVRVLDVKEKEEVEYRLVGSAESNPRKGLISDESPLGAAIMGHKAGDKVVVNTPAGEMQYKVLAILK